MMILEESILVDAPPGRLSEFFDRMADHYTDWHPDHHHFEWRSGHGCKAGNVFYFEETIADKRQSKQVVFTKVVLNRAIEFAPTSALFRLFLPEMSFQFEPEGEQTRVVSRIVLRIGPLAKWMHRQEFVLVRQHMREECENLKRMVETGAPE